MYNKELNILHFLYTFPNILMRECKSAYCYYTNLDDTYFNCETVPVIIHLWLGTITPSAYYFVYTL